MQPNRKSNQLVTKSSYWRERWDNIKDPANALVEDAMLFAIFAACLVLVWAILGLLTFLGYEPERLYRFGQIHYWAYVTVFGLFMFDLVLRVALHVFGKRQNAAKNL